MFFSTCRKAIQAGCTTALLLVGLMFAPSCSSAAQSGIIFCESFTDEIEPIGVSEVFKTNEVSWIVFSTEPFGVSHLTFSIYRENDTTEKLLHREECDVRSSWNNIFLEKMPFPGDGIYSLSFTKPDGIVLAEGKVTIDSKIKPEDAAPLPEKVEVKGTTLDELFIKFKMLANVAQ